VEVRVKQDGTDNEDLIIIDAGSGIRLLGSELMNEMPINAHIFFSHVHWDHIQGFPFFTPGFIQGNVFHLYGLKYSQESLSSLYHEETPRSAGDPYRVPNNVQPQTLSFGKRKAYAQGGLPGIQGLSLSYPFLLVQQDNISQILLHNALSGGGTYHTRANNAYFISSHSYSPLIIHVFDNLPTIHLR